MEWIDLLGCPISKIDMNDCLRQIERFIYSGKAHQLVVVNAAKLLRMQEDTELKDIILAADLVGADGVPIVWASNILGTPLPGRINGTDLMEKLIDLAAEKKYRIYFFGAEEEVVEKVVEVCKAMYPDLQVAGWRNGYFKPEEENEIVREIRNSKADILLVGMGTPMKEKFVYENLKELNVPVCHGVGGSFDVLAGKVKRAPVWMQRNGLEWFYRLIQEPGRLWKRYLVGNTMFVWLVFKKFTKLKIKELQRNLSQKPLA